MLRQTTHKVLAFDFYISTKFLETEKGAPIIIISQGFMQTYLWTLT